MNQRINITLPQETLELLDRNVAKGDRSNFIDRAVKYYISSTAKKILKQKQGAERWSERDLQITED